ncbi:MAG: hypothetical protein HY653_00265 [Acidobacteria bacterium]|nr:hypothetical protein [Acidobacteriota bacterium]
MHKEASQATLTERATVHQAVWKPYAIGLAGWLVPGLGHLLLRKLDRAAAFFFSIVALAGLGLAMGGHLFDWEPGNFFHMLGFLADLGVGLLFFGAKMVGLGTGELARALGDYGTSYFLTAGVLNILTALDAYDIAAGKKE